MQQKQIYDSYGFPKHFYDPKYAPQESPEVATEIAKLVSTIEETDEWGLDHGAWPMLMHLFPAADVPVFQMSINYNAKPEYHYKLSKLASPTPDHYVPILYSLGMLEKKDKIEFFYDETPTIPAFSERSFIIKPENT